MPRPRRKTETLGCLITIEERRAMQTYLRERRMTATQYLREAAVNPVMEMAAQAEGGPDEQN
jgi:hypothetical protein